MVAYYILKLTSSIYIREVAGRSGRKIESLVERRFYSDQRPVLAFET